MVVESVRWEQAPTVRVGLKSIRIRICSNEKRFTSMDADVGDACVAQTKTKGLFPE